jgi:hypothetical protein
VGNTYRGGGSLTARDNSTGAGISTGGRKSFETVMDRVTSADNMRVEKGSFPTAKRGSSYQGEGGDYYMSRLQKVVHTMAPSYTSGKPDRKALPIKVTQNPNRKKQIIKNGGNPDDLGNY